MRAAVAKIASRPEATRLIRIPKRMTKFSSLPQNNDLKEFVKTKIPGLTELEIRRVIEQLNNGN